MPSLDTSQFLENLTQYRVRNYLEAIDDMMFSKLRGNSAQERDARARMSEVIRETMGTCEVLGASIVLRHAARWLPDTGNFSSRDSHYLMVFSDIPAQTIIPRVSFSEAVQDMVDRTPMTIQNAARRTALRISTLYETGDVIAFVRSADQAVTEKVQDFFSKAIRAGVPESQIGKVTPKIVKMFAEETKEWAEGYSRMAFRTNANTAITAGRFKQAQDPDIQGIIPAFMFETAGDSDVRDNHALCDGLIFKVSNPIWNDIAPPLGYNCRCDTLEMSGPQLRRMNKLRDPDDFRTVIESVLPEGAGADPAPFLHLGRPDLFTSAAIG